MILAPRTQIRTVALRILMLTFQGAPFAALGVGGTMGAKHVVIGGLRIPDDVPNVAMFVQIPATRAGSSAWDWRSLTGTAHVAEDRANDHRELERVMLSYGNVVSYMYARTLSAPRFRLLVRGLYSGRTLGTYEWAWDVYRGAYAPVGEPWLLTCEAPSSTPAKPVGFTLSGLTRLACTVVPDCCLPPDPGPFVRHKEDVPHEGALADLYGLPRAA